MKSKDRPRSQRFPLDEASDFSLISPGDLLNIIRQRWLLGLAVGLLAAGVVGYMKLAEEPRYAAETSLVVEINPEKIVQLQDVARGTEGSGLVDSIMNTYLERLKSRSMADFVLETMGDEELAKLIDAYPYAAILEIEETGKQIPQIQGSLLGSVSASWQEGSQIVRIKAVHTEPRLAQLYAQKYAEAFIELQSSRIEERTGQALDFLNEQSIELQSRLEEGERQLQQYRSENDLASIEGNIDIVSARLGQLNSAVTEEKIRLIASENKLRQIEVADGNLAELMQIGFIAERPRIAAIAAELENARHRRSILNETYLHRHPLMTENAAEIEALEANLSKFVEEGIREIRKDYEVVLSGYESLKAEMNEVEAQALELDRLAIEYRVLQRKLDVQRQIFDVVSEQFTSTDVSSQFDVASIRVLDDARLPGRPFSPNVRKVGMISAFLFFSCFIGVPLFVERLDNRLKTFADIEGFVGKPVFGDIKRFKDKDDTELSNAVRENDEDLAESFRGIYSSLKLHTECRPPYSFLITSAIPSEGKTFIACNLGMVFARHHSRVLLIDCDLRRPSVHRQLKIDNEVGLISWVDGDEPLPPGAGVATDTRLGIKEISPQFFVLPSGGSTKQPTEIIGHHRFDRLVSRLKESFDIIIFDTPPVGLFPDATMIADFARGTLFVSKQHAVTKQKAKYAVTRLERTESPVAGVVLNYISGRSVATGYGYYGSTYGYGYGYGYENDAKKYKKYYAQAK